MIAIDTQGTKAEVKVAIDKAVSNSCLRAAFKRIVDAGAGNMVNISVTMSKSPHNTHGAFTMSGSFWTATL